MKSTIRPIFMATVLALGLTACSDDNTPTPAQKTDAPKTTPAAQQDANLPTYKIRSPNHPYPPFNIVNSNNTVSGLEIDILAAVAKDQNIKIEHVPYVWEVIFNDLRTDGISMVGGGLVKSDFGTDEVVASVPYMRAPDCVVASKPSNLDKWHTRVVAIRETDGEEEDLMQNFGVARSNIITVRSQYQGLQELLADKIPTLMGDCSVIRYYIKQSFNDQKDKFHLQELPRSENDVEVNEQMVIAVHKNYPELLEKINNGIQNIKANGELDRILQKWL